jgi:hypothetical protein
MGKGNFNLFLLIVCLVALPFYAAGAAFEGLLEGGQKPLPTFRPSRRFFSRPSPVSVCPCCGSYLQSRY